MVKGVARHAVIVKSPDMKDFEQAIFILSGQSENTELKSPDEMLQLACSLASDCCGKNTAASKKERFLRPIMYFAAGSGFTAALWWIITSFFIV